jgi:hypothetical protein
MHIRRMHSLFCISALLLTFIVGCSGSSSSNSMLGYWADPNNITTTIQTENGITTAVSVYDLNQPQGKNLVESSSFAYGSLIWRYCMPDNTCQTVKTVRVNGDSMTVNVTNDKGETSPLTLTRVAKGTP